MLTGNVKINKFQKHVHDKYITNLSKYLTIYFHIEKLILKFNFRKKF